MVNVFVVYYAGARGTDRIKIKVAHV